MSDLRVHRYASLDELAYHVADQLLREIKQLQSRQYLAQICLPGGSTAEAVLAQFGPLVAAHAVDPGRLELWWSEDRFVATSDPNRHIQRALALLGGAFPLDPARTHPIPTPVGDADVDAAAAAYATELGEVGFDVCLLSLGGHGQVAALHQGSPGLTSSRSAVGVEDRHVPPQQRVTLTPKAINRSAAVWVMASGAGKARFVARALAGDETMPAAHVRGTVATQWFVDADAAVDLPSYHCAW